MTQTLDISATTTGRSLPRHQAEVIARVKGLNVDDYLFIRGRYRQPGMDADTDYVLLQRRDSREWLTFELPQINDELLKETANVP